MRAMFPATQWTDLARATLHGDAAGRTALESLCRTYWEPVRQAIVVKGWSRDEAPDLAQSFFLYLMEQSVLNRADREKGKFRSFLQGVLGHWLIDEHRRRHTAKRGSGQIPAALDEVPEAAHPAGEGPAEREFDRQWARAVMQAALGRLRMEIAGKRGDECFSVMGVFLGAGGESMSYEEASARIGLSLAAFKTEVLTWRRRLREHLRAEVRRTVTAPHEIDEEMEYLRSLLAA